MIGQKKEEKEGEKEEVRREGERGAFVCVCAILVESPKCVIFDKKDEYDVTGYMYPFPRDE